MHSRMTLPGSSSGSPAPSHPVGGTAGQGQSPRRIYPAIPLGVPGHVQRERDIRRHHTFVLTLAGPCIPLSVLCPSTGRRVPCHHPAPSGRCHFRIQCDSVCLWPLRYSPVQRTEEGTGWWGLTLPDGTTHLPCPGLPGSFRRGRGPEKQVKSSLFRT